MYSITQWLLYAYNCFCIYGDLDKDSDGQAERANKDRLLYCSNKVHLWPLPVKQFSKVQNLLKLPDTNYVEYMSEQIKEIQYKRERRKRKLLTNRQAQNYDIQTNKLTDRQIDKLPNRQTDRPIAIGEARRRVSAHAICVQKKAQFRAFFSPSNMEWQQRVTEKCWCNISSCC